MREKKPHPFGIDRSKIDRDNIEFVYVVFEPNVPYHDKDGCTWNPNYLGTFKWGAKYVGFGEIAMYRMSADPEKPFVAWFDAETESKSFIKQMLCHMVDSGFTDSDKELPECFRQYFPG